VSLAIEGREGDRWQSRVRIRPRGVGVDLAGATLCFVDEDGAPSGPVVVLPLDGPLSDDVVLQAGVRGPERLPPGAVLRLTVFLAGTCEALVWDEPVARREGFQDFVAGRTLFAVGPASEGRNLTSEEIERLAAAFPWLAEAEPAPEAGKAFDVFQEDLLASMDLDEDESVTEEILRMLRET